MSNEIIYSKYGYFYDNVRPYVSNVPVSLLFGVTYFLEGEIFFDASRIIGFFSGYPCEVKNKKLNYGIKYSNGFVKLKSSENIFVLKNGCIIKDSNYYIEDLKNAVSARYFECYQVVSIDQTNHFNFEKDFDGKSVGFFSGDTAEYVPCIIDGIKYYEKTHGFNHATGRIVLVPFEFIGGFHYWVNFGNIEEIPLDIV
jgi:hypothetical protein